jgi:hypothetical protein
MDMPTQEIEGKTYYTQTMNLGDNTKFKGKVYLYNLSFTPEMYDPNLLLKPVKNGAAIGPTIYDPIDFTPRKHILTWNPEMAQDISGINKELTFKNDIHKLLDDVLDNPEEYRVKGVRGIMVRAVFKTKNEDQKEPPYLIGTPIDPDSYMAYYMEKKLDQTPNQLNLTLKSKPIPKHLKDEFIKRFTDNGGIATATTEEIENFIKENTMERDTSWDDPQLSDGDMPIRHMNALKNTFPDIEIQKEVEPQSQLDELNDYLRMLADMDKIGIRRKLFLLEGYMNKVISQLKNK